MSADTDIGLSVSEYLYWASGSGGSEPTPPTMRRWTPNFNGVNSYIQIPEIITGSFVGNVEFTTGLTVVANWGDNHPTQNGTPIIGYNASNLDGFVHLDNMGGQPQYSVVTKSLNPAVNVPITRGERFDITFTGRTSSTRRIQTIGRNGRTVSKYYRGIVTRFTVEHDGQGVILEPMHRDYQLVIESETIPTTTTIVDTADGEHGTMINFGTERPWIEIDENGVPV